MIGWRGQKYACSERISHCSQGCLGRHWGSLVSSPSSPSSWSSSSWWSSRWVDGEMIVRDGREEEGWRELEGILDKKWTWYDHHYSSWWSLLIIIIKITINGLWIGAQEDKKWTNLLNRSFMRKKQKRCFRNQMLQKKHQKKGKNKKDNQKDWYWIVCLRMLVKIYCRFWYKYTDSIIISYRCFLYIFRENKI